VFGVVDLPEWPARYNIAPTQLVPVVRQRGDGTRQIVLMRWGLIPSWAKEAGEGLINARAETVNEKPSFRQSFRQRRCILPASGFYEWQKAEKHKIPHFVRLKNQMPMPFAGIWDAWRAPDGQVIESCAILTTMANGAVGAIHERMPVILDPAGFALWLDLAVHAAEQLVPLLVSCPPGQVEVYPVTTLVNSPTNDSPACIEPVPLATYS
jgi:putative SOS response-associated peptidase YedK